MKIHGPAVAAFREFHGMTQSQLATAAGVSQPRICQIEAGHPNVKPATARAIADALSVAVRAVTIPDHDQESAA